MDATYTRTGRPPFPFLTFLLLPNVALAGVMALRPSPGIRFGASLVLILTSVYAAVTYTVGGAPVVDYSLSAFLGSMLLNTMLFAWPLDEAKDIHYLRYPGPLAERPLWMRFWHSLCIIFNPRLIGTNAQVRPDILLLKDYRTNARRPQVSHVPSPYKGTRTRYLLRCLRQLLVNLTMIDVLESFIFTHIHLYDPSRSDGYFPPGVTGYLARPACTAFWLIWSYTTMKTTYILTAALAVSTNLWSPEDWPDIFGNLSDAYTVRRFWGYVVFTLA